MEKVVIICLATGTTAGITTQAPVTVTATAPRITYVDSTTMLTETSPIFLFLDE
ncbi:MAG: hypothetical protein J6K49_05265 [Clostridia bacterium]|nr:hypothetical protein [Clostridia bacterium]MBP3560056.1 hypothetical protein [Clostridia bacterium]